MDHRRSSTFRLRPVAGRALAGRHVARKTAAGASAQDRALRECGSSYSVMLTSGLCAALRVDPDADSTVVGWAESYDSASGTRPAALSACSSRGGGSGCVVRVSGCDGPVMEEGLGPDRTARRQIQLGLRSAGFDPGGTDGLFDPGRGRRFGIGSRRAGHERQGIWTLSTPRHRRP